MSKPKANAFITLGGANADEVAKLLALVSGNAADNSGTTSKSNRRGASKGRGKTSNNRTKQAERNFRCYAEGAADDHGVTLANTDEVKLAWLKRKLLCGACFGSGKTSTASVETMERIAADMDLELDGEGNITNEDTAGMTWNGDSNTSDDSDADATEPTNDEDLDEDTDVANTTATGPEVW